MCDNERSKPHTLKKLWVFTYAIVVHAGTVMKARPHNMHGRAIEPTRAVLREGFQRPAASYL